MPRPVQREVDMPLLLHDYGLPIGGDAFVPPNRLLEHALVVDGIRAKDGGNQRRILLLPGPFVYLQHREQRRVAELGLCIIATTTTRGPRQWPGPSSRSPTARMGFAYLTTARRVSPSHALAYHRAHMGYCV
jgi:hypothetical protein